MKSELCVILYHILFPIAIRSHITEIMLQTFKAEGMDIEENNGHKIVDNKQKEERCKAYAICGSKSDPLSSFRSGLHGLPVNQPQDHARPDHVRIRDLGVLCNNISVV